MSGVALSHTNDEAKFQTAEALADCSLDAGRPCVQCRYALAAHADYGHLTADELEEMPTLEQGQADDLKIATVDERVWLCRCDVADGMPVDNAVTVEYLLNGRWVEVAFWEAS